jgi:hypothetical protein
MAGIILEGVLFVSKRWNGQMQQVTGGARPMLQLPGATK